MISTFVLLCHPSALNASWRHLIRRRLPSNLRKVPLDFHLRTRTCIRPPHLPEPVRVPTLLSMPLHREHYMTLLQCSLDIMISRYYRETSTWLPYHRFLALGLALALEVAMSLVCLPLQMISLMQHTSPDLQRAVCRHADIPCRLPGPRVVRKTPNAYPPIRQGRKPPLRGK